MKKFFLFAFIISFGVSNIFSENCSPIKVYKPVKDSMHWSGYNLNIKWINKIPVPKRKTPPVVQKSNLKILRVAKIKHVKIELKLVKPFVLKMMNWRTIFTSTLDDGSVDWKIPKKLRKGIYKIRVTRLWCSSGDPDRVAVSKEFKILHLFL